MTLTANNNFEAEILVADPTPDHLHLLVNVLQKNGYKVRRVEQKRLTSEDKMRAVFAAMTDIVIIIHLQQGQLGNIEILPTNSISIYNAGTDIISRTIEQFFQIETSKTWLKLFQQALETQQTINFDYSLTCKENIFWLTAAISPMCDNSIVFVARDISKRKQTEDALRIAKERYHSIFENAIDGIFQLTPEGRYLSVNPALARICGYASPQELLNSIQDVAQQLYIDPNYRREFMTAIAGNDIVSGFESMVYRKDGTPIWISETTRAVRDSTGKLLYYEGRVSEITERKLAQEVLKFQQAQSEELVLNILPQPIADRLQAGESLIADQFDEVSVLFADLVGFTPFSARKTPAALVEFLNEIFSKFDQLAEKYGLEKIKTIGDAYMVVGGLPKPSSDHANKIAQMALEMQDCLAQFNAKHAEELQLRIGINTGSVVAGVIGMSKFSYDLWGDTVNIASRMESSGRPGKIQVTPSTYECLKEDFEFKQRGIIAVKGKGEMMTYWLLGKLEDNVKSQGSRVF
ncbi:diguanylate cyclase [Nostocales cyanobacterium HT-58-2]|nr:diguanylate cyclase [Nostocales cyanobacterium HT-58-2]